MDWKRTKDRITRFYAWVSETDTDLDVMSPSKANVILYVMRLVVTVSCFVMCCTCHGRFFSGIDYAGHGVWGWIGLWFTCAWGATIQSIAVMWFLGVTPLKKPRWDYFGFGLAFLALFLSGLSRHVPSPILGEMMVGSAASLLIYLGLFVEKQ